MRFVVRPVVVLVGEESARDLGGEPPRHPVVALGVLGREIAVDQHELHAERPQRVDLLRAGLLAHHHDAAQLVLDRHHRQPHRGVARGRLDDRAAGAETAVGERPLDHVAGDPVLHAAHRIHVLELGVDLAREAGHCAAQAHHRRLAGGIGDLVEDSLGTHRERG